MHAPDCKMKLSKPSEEGTACVLVPCSCGQRDREYAEIQRLLDRAGEEKP
jgi:hypothetical protein